MGLLELKCFWGCLVFFECCLGVVWVFFVIVWCCLLFFGFVGAMLAVARNGIGVENLTSVKKIK